MELLATLFAEVEKRADAEAAVVISSILDEVFSQDSACHKCTVLFVAYVRARKMETLVRRSEFYMDKIPAVNFCVTQARQDFHSASCTCGLELWRGSRWRAKQPARYQLLFNRYMRSRTCL